MNEHKFTNEKALKVLEICEKFVLGEVHCSECKNQMMCRMGRIEKEKHELINRFAKHRRLQEESVEE